MQTGMRSGSSARRVRGMTAVASHPAPDPDAGRRIVELDRAHVFHSWSAQALFSPMAVAGAEGSYLWDYDGNRYLDFSSQLVNTNIGHQHPKVVEAIREQAARLCTIAPQHANDVRSEAARLIAEVAPDGLNKIFFTNGGADAIENAVRMARLHTGRHRSSPPIAPTTGRPPVRQTDRRPAPLGRRTGASPEWCAPSGPVPLYRSAFHATTLSRRVRGHWPTCGRSSNSKDRTPSPRSRWSRWSAAAGCCRRRPATWPASALLRQFRILWIADEVMIGFGRLGEWFGYQAFDRAADGTALQPDLVTFAKRLHLRLCSAGRRGDPGRHRVDSFPSQAAPTLAASPTPVTRWPAQSGWPRSRSSSGTALWPTFGSWPPG